ncbi:properdin-like [Alosa sapidissima]|uniref:properdin-like n=1 Tax=Alosa sapidissima TaxID=34773 RepID=UPI001C0910F7|nr:properdin-like [Alosa sapidissima]
MVYTMLLVFSIQYILFLLPQAIDSQLVSCYFKFDTDTGNCVSRIGDVTQDECCFNSQYGFKNENGECVSCRNASWSAWSPWGPCSVSCLKGVQQRRRRCDGIGKCNDSKNLGTLQTAVCEDQDCCPEQGGWGEWGAWQPCSVTCGKGVSRREKPCNNPPPKCGGGCDGPGQDTQSCETGVVCPTHGSWSDWGTWSPCLGTCRMEGATPPPRERRRTCTNPSPSSVPAGRPCQGPDTDTQDCYSLPICPTHGAWGAWSSLSECSVTCGVGLQSKTRKCNNPAPKYGGNACLGDHNAYAICIIQTHCPVDGEWGEWREWETCKKETYNRPISCTKKAGSQARRRSCLFRDFGGKACDGLPVEHRLCYDIKHTTERPCEKPAHYTEWTEWGLCKPSCGAGSKRRRGRLCVADIPEFEKTTYGDVYYSGLPRLKCSPILMGINKTQEEPCLNVPAC